MAARRRTIAVCLVLSVLAGIAVGYGALSLILGGRSLWGFTPSWQQMEDLLESQVIAGTALEVSLDPAHGEIDGHATLQVTRPGGDGSQVVLLLNAGLSVRSVTSDGENASWSRQEERLFVRLPEGVTASEVTITYRGALQSTNDSLLVYSSEELLADRLQFWYPLDLKNFGEFSATVRVPEAMQVAWSGTLVEEVVEDAVRTVRWKEDRPILGAGLAAGRFDKVSRMQGSVRCNVYGRDLDPDAVEMWLTAVGESCNYFHAMLGPDNFPQMNLIVTEGAKSITRIGGPAIVAPPMELADSDAIFVVLARQVAQNWWGDTVSGRWFSSRPEAGEWLVSGMSEYSAWQALRSVKGRRSYLRYMEQLYFPPTTTVPMKTFNLGQRLRRGEAPDPRLLNVRGPFVAATIAQYIGQTPFDRACRNFMAVHRYTTVSYAALIHEMTLAAEQPLDELVRVWFDRPGTFDYGVSGVAVEGGRVHVTIDNDGDIPTYVPVDLGIVTEDGYQVHAVRPGAHGDAVSYPIDSPLKRVVLDPEFASGDMRRANNAWPPTQWPLGLDVSRNGRIAMLAQTQWGNRASRQLFVFSLVDKTAEYTIDAGGLRQGFRWDLDGQYLAVPGVTPRIWQGRQWTQGKTGSVFLGWLGDEPVFWNGSGLETPEKGIIASPATALPPPVPGLAAVHPPTGSVAYVTESELLVVWDSPAGRLLPVSEGVRPAGDLQWRETDAKIVYFRDDGDLVAVDPEGGVVSTLLRRNYHIAQSRISYRGTHAAWVDPAGLLRAYTPNRGEPVYISLPGEVVDFAWEGEDALVAIVATVPRRLPMRFHADYTLWRIPVSTWQGVQLPYDPIQFAEGAARSDRPAWRDGAQPSGAGR